jgi:hypothetical protein
MTTQGSRIARPFRLWLFIEVLFGLAALASIGRFPDQTARRFAWEIKPVVMAAFLGGLYFATAPILLLQAAAKRWEMIRVMIPTAIAFTTTELVATFLHWDKFSVGTLPFYVWFASYLLPPPIFITMYLYQQRRASPTPGTSPLPKTLRLILLALGAFLTLESVVAFVFPVWFTRSFPWQLTPLTARVLCGWLIAVGTLMLSIARENDRDRVRLASPLLILLLPAVAFQIARYGDQVDTSSPRLWVGLVIFSVIGACGLYLARGSWRESLS